MQKKHLLWIIPLSVCITAFLCGYIEAIHSIELEQDYPVISCIVAVEPYISDIASEQGITEESMRAYLQHKCAIDNIDISINDSKQLMIMEVD